MTDASKAVVWDAVWLPWGAPYQITGPEALDARFPGALFLVNTRRAGVERGSSTARMRVAGAGRHPKPRRNGIRSAVQRAACITTGTGITIPHSAATPSPIRSASSMGRVCMRMRSVRHTRLLTPRGSTGGARQDNRNVQTRYIQTTHQFTGVCQTNRMNRRIARVVTVEYIQI